jgi:hypothetical protein
MLVVRAVESRADPLGQLVGAKHSVGLDHFAFAVNALGLHRIESHGLFFLGNKQVAILTPSFPPFLRARL